MPIQPASINWKDSAPFSSSHQDIYFNPSEGVDESLYVFYDGNELGKVIEHAQDNAHFSIAETGFGTGLNFLVTAQEWLSKAPTHTQLNYISVEKHPLSKYDLEKALQGLSVNLSITDTLVQHYPDHSPGFHTILFAEGRIRLALMLGDAAECYSKLNAKVDAWYLDGFAPSKNPDMWSPELFREIARLSHKGTTLATFTAAGLVRRGLQKVGFDVQKRKGFGRKREMLVGTFTGEHKKEPSKSPWSELPESIKPTEVTIIGGGLAGCSTAYALASRGIKVRLIEKEGALATGGSGNRQGALYAKLPVKPTKQGELHTTGLIYTQNQLKQLDPNHTFWSPCGVVQLAESAKEQGRHRELVESGYYPETLVTLKTPEELSTLSGARITQPGLYFPDAGWVSPRELCTLFARHEKITIHQAEVNELTHNGEQWLLETAAGPLQASHVVICNAEQANSFAQTEHLPLKTIRGQVSLAPIPDNTPELNTVICAEGYISPAKENRYCFGATFDLKGRERNITAADHEQNLKNLADILPDLAARIAENLPHLEGRTAFRCSTPDYMPIVGPAPVYEDFIEQFANLRKDKNWRFGEVTPHHYPNLYINTGHGSKGLITCPISAELLASMICDEPLPLPTNLIDMLNPARFIIKNLIKQAI